MWLLYERMFASVDRLESRPAPDEHLISRIRPMVAPSARLLPVVEALQPLLPDGGLRRGSTTVVVAPPGHGGATLALTLLSAPSAAGHWCGVVGMGDPGITAMTELGVDLRRVVFVPTPGGKWAEVAGELIDGTDVILIRLGLPVPHAVARNLIAKARDRSAVLVILTATSGQWPIGGDVELSIPHAAWVGANAGHGHLAGRRAAVSVIGRRGANQEHTATLWLPSASGDVTGAAAR